MAWFSRVLRVSCSINLNGNFWKNQAINFCLRSTFGLHGKGFLTTQMVIFQHYKLLFVFCVLFFFPLMWISGPEINPTGVQGAGTQKNNMEITWTVSSSLMLDSHPASYCYGHRC